MSGTVTGSAGKHQVVDRRRRGDRLALLAGDSHERAAFFEPVATAFDSPPLLGKFKLFPQLTATDWSGTRSPPGLTPPRCGPSIGGFLSFVSDSTSRRIRVYRNVSRRTTTLTFVDLCRTPTRNAVFFIVGVSNLLNGPGVKYRRDFDVVRIHQCRNAL